MTKKRKATTKKKGELKNENLLERKRPKEVQKRRM